MELISPNNVTSFSNLPMYKRMLKKVDTDLHLNGAMEFFYLLSESTQCDSSAVMLDEKSFLSCTDAEYEIVYKSARSFLCLEDGDKIVEITAIAFDDKYKAIEENRKHWKNNKTDKKFSRLLLAQMWDGSPLISDIITYLDKLYDLGYRLFKNDKVDNNVKMFQVFKDDVVVAVTIDYNTITKIVELYELDQSEID